MIRAVVFDLDDTLFPEHQFVLSGFRVVSQWVAEKYSMSGFQNLAEKFFREGKRKNIFNLVLDQMEVPYTLEFLSQLIAIYREHTPMLSLYEDAKWAISFFGKTKKLGIISDGFLKTQQNKIKALGIADYFDAIVLSDEFGRPNWKPSERPYCKIMESLMCEGDECVYIADNPSKDFITANYLNWTTIQICRVDGEYSNITCETDYEPKAKINSLFELRELIP